jgi:hypothetical protein
MFIAAVIVFFALSTHAQYCILKPSVVKNLYLYNSIDETTEYLLDDWFEGFNLTYSANGSDVSNSV